MFAAPAMASTDIVTVHVFMRDDCTYCKAQKEFLADLATERSDFTVMWHNIAIDADDNALYQRLVATKEIPRVTPVVVIGDVLIQGFNAPETTGVRMENSIDAAKKVDTITVEDFISGKASEIIGSANDGCESDDLCTVEFEQPINEFTFKLPFVGIVDLQTFSLSTLSIVLGIVDGFNPCALWVLLTFLLVLMQVGDRKRMFQIAGLFILAEGIMYALILNVWYATWDFVKLDSIVTPAVGMLSLSSGAYFLYKWRKSRKELTCATTSLETQSKITKKINEIAAAPLTFITALGIIGLAFSVNIIEFACSIGIPQAFTKILELNTLSTLQTQAYIAVYTLFYMVDDIIVFGLALWGFDKLHTASHKYSLLSMLIGGILMLILGGLLIFAPQLLTL